jgi:hypothetical protein
MALKKSELYSSLWASCDELRGGLRPRPALHQIRQRQVRRTALRAYYHSRGASFKDMVALKGKTDIGDQINKKIIAPLANAKSCPTCRISTTTVHARMRIPSSIAWPAFDWKYLLAQRASLGLRDQVVICTTAASSNGVAGPVVPRRRMRRARPLSDDEWHNIARSREDGQFTVSVGDGGTTGCPWPARGRLAYRVLLGGEIGSSLCAQAVTMPSTTSQRIAFRGQLGKRGQRDQTERCCAVGPSDLSQRTRAGRVA